LAFREAIESHSSTSITSHQPFSHQPFVDPSQLERVWLMASTNDPSADVWLMASTKYHQQQATQRKEVGSGRALVDLLVNALVNALVAVIAFFFLLWYSVLILIPLRACIS
jgi:hypothetical protein